MRTFFLMAGMLASTTFALACEPYSPESSSDPARTVSAATVVETEPPDASPKTLDVSRSFQIAVFDDPRSPVSGAPSIKHIAAESASSADYMDTMQNRRLIDQNDKIIAQNEKIIDLLEKILDNADDSNDKLISQNDRIITLLDRLVSKR